MASAGCTSSSSHAGLAKPQSGAATPVDEGYDLAGRRLRPGRDGSKCTEPSHRADPAVGSMASKATSLGGRPPASIGWVRPPQTRRASAISEIATTAPIINLAGEEPLNGKVIRGIGINWVAAWAVWQEADHPALMAQLRLPSIRRVFPVTRPVRQLPGPGIKQKPLASWTTERAPLDSCFGL